MADIFVFDKFNNYYCSVCWKHVYIVVQKRNIFSDGLKRVYIFVQKGNIFKPKLC